ncbi:MAG: SLBB domain-containing protein, partial [Nitrospinota bacterium]
MPPQSSQQAPSQQPPAEEKTSEFEQYVGEKIIKVSEAQFETLKKLEGIRFSYISRPSHGEVSFPIRITKEVEVITRDIDAGFLIGTPEAIQNAFKILGIRSPSGISTDIKQFGYDLFRQPPSTFAPIDKIPVGPDYVVGPGDEIRVTVWGKVEGGWNVTVDRDGKISLPKIGVLGVTGLTFKELKDLLYKEMSKYYTGFEMNVSMGNLRTLRVYVVGNAERPGAYTVSSLSTLINALFESGGISKTGTMRDIQLKRNGKVIVNFDIYDFLLKGDKTKDVRLMPEDVIFIPTVGPLVGIAGNVKVPAIYELKGETKLLDLINMAGGLNNIAFKGRLQVQRVEEHQFRTIFESDLINIEKRVEKNFPLKDGDMVKVFSVAEANSTVTVVGAVVNPGEYGIAPGITSIRDIISLSGGLVQFTSNQSEITRLKITQSGPLVERFNIDPFKAMEGLSDHNIPLEINDYIFIKSIPEWELYRSVNISGEVKFPGSYIIKKGERLSSLIERAGGFTDRAYLKGSLFTRESVRILQQKSLDEAVDRMEQIILSQTASTVETAISGEEVQQRKAAIEQRRELLSKLRAAKAQGRLIIKIDTSEKLKGTGTEADIELEDKDMLFIPSQPSSITVMGAVFNQNSFLYDPKGGISSYIKLAGGITREADEKSVFILKVDGTAISKRQEGWGFMRTKLDPGDTIVVPHEYEKIAW